MFDYDFHAIEASLQNPNDDGLAALIDQACLQVQADFEVDSTFKNLVDGAVGIEANEDPALANRVEVSRWPFLYVLGREALFTGGIREVFVPMLQSGEDSYPPKPSSLPKFVVAYLSRAALRLSSAPARARFNDVLFCAHYEPQTTSLAAIDSYLELVESSWSDLEIAEGLLRSSRLARSIKDDQRLNRSLTSTFAFSQSKLHSDSGPGVVLPLLESLITKNSPYFAEGVALLREALSIYSDPHVQDGVLTTLISATRDEAEKVALGGDRVRLWLDAAQQVTNPVRLMHLETAVRIAEDLGVPNLRAEARDQLQLAAHDDLGMERFQQRIELPSSAVDEYLAQFTSAGDIWEALLRLSAHQPVTGSVDDTRRIAEETDRIAPLQAIIPTVRLGADGLPSWRPQTPSEIEDARLAKHETLRLQVTSDLLARGLMAIGDHYGVPDHESLTAHFESRPNMTAPVARNLALGFGHFWRQEFNEAALFTVWNIETLARNLLLTANQGLYRAQRESRPGQYPGLGFLLDRLQSVGLDPSWYRCLWTVFASPAGLNLRNEIAHGFVADVPYGLTAVTLHCLDYLSTLTVSQEE